jgi:hypothetical protein
MTPGAAGSIARAAQEKDNAVQATAVQNAAKALENTQQSSQAASNIAIAINQDMSANSATAAANFASQTIQTSIQTSTAQSGSQQQNQQSGTPSQQNNRIVQQVQQQEIQQAQNQIDSSVVQNQQFLYAMPQQLQDIQQSNTVSLRPTMSVQTETQLQASVGTGLSVNHSSVNYNLFNATNTSNTITTPTTVHQPRLEPRQAEIETPLTAMSSFDSQSRSGNPLSDLVQQRMELPQTNTEQRTETVKRDIQTNELAGGVDIASIAKQPAGFSAYSIVLRDTAFYEPKEVYKNQRTVDNVRLLRGLTGGSDAKHNEMVNSQYK